MAKEYIAAQDPTDPGVLILSRFAGAAEELTDALIINPFDADEIAHAMHQALSMSLHERLRRYRGMRDRVWDTTADTRYMVLPMQPPDTAGWPEDKLAAIVTRDSMIGVARL